MAVAGKLTELGLLTHDRYHIAFVMDRTSMFEVNSLRSGKEMTHEVKALAIIWHQFPQFGPHNTVHVDDLSRNFAMNPGSGIKISAYKNYTSARHTDEELRFLSRYLDSIVVSTDFTSIDFSKWRKIAEDLPRQPWET